MCRVLVVLCALFLAFADVACDCTAAALNVRCTHVNDVNLYGTDRWDELVVNNTKKEPLIQLPSNAFSAAPNVKYLTVDGWLNSLAPGAFHGLKKITSLALENNRIRTLPSNIFAGVNVYTLDLTRDGIETLATGCFNNVNNLGVINVLWNPLRQLRRGVFNGLPLRELYVQHCEITSIENGAFENMNSLEILSLRGNRLTEFDVPRLLGSSASLLWLSLKNNEFTTVTRGMLQNVPELLTISLENNRISSVQPGAFSAAPKLEQIYLNNNSLAALKPNVFPVQGLPKLDWLHMDYNRLTYLEPELLRRVSNLGQLCIGGNPLFCGCDAEIKKWRASNNVVCYTDTKYFASGQRPSCIALHGDQCVYGDSSPEAMSLIQLYLDQLPEYIDDNSKV